MEDGHLPISHLLSPISPECDDQHPVESGKKTAPAVCRHLVAGILRPRRVVHRQKNRTLVGGGNRLGGLWGLICAGRLFPRPDPAGVRRPDSGHVSHRLGGLPCSFGSYFLWNRDTNRLDLAVGRPRSSPVAAPGGHIDVENPGWQDQPSQLSSAKLMKQNGSSKFEEQAAKAGGGVFQEFWIFLKENKKWWLLPILLALFLMGALLLAGGTGAAPFIYTLF